MNNETSKPDPEQFARVVLWHLCNLEISISLLQSKVIQQSGIMAGAGTVEILKEKKEYGELVRKLAEPLYLDALQKANIKPSPTFPPPRSL